MLTRIKGYTMPYIILYIVYPFTETPWSPLNPMLTDSRITEYQLRGRIRHLHRDADAEKIERIFNRFGI